MGSVCWRWADGSWGISIAASFAWRTAWAGRQILSARGPMAVSTQARWFVKSTQVIACSSSSFFFSRWSW